MAKVIRDTWKQWYWESADKRQNILNSKYNLIDLDSSFDLAGAGQTFKWGVSNNILTDATNITSTTELTPATLEQYKMTGVVIRRGTAFSNTEIYNQWNGEDVLKPAILNQIGSLQERWHQKDLANVLTGAFAVTTTDHAAAPFKKDLTGVVGSGAILTTETANKIVAERYPSLDTSLFQKTIIMNHAVLDKFVSSNTSNFAQDKYAAGDVFSLGGYNLIPNGTLCPKTAGVDDAPDTYISYICLDQPFMMSEQIALNIGYKEDAAVGGGSYSYYIYMHYSVGLKNVSWMTAGGESPTEAALATAANWNWNYGDTENVPITQVKSLIIAGVE